MSTSPARQLIASATALIAAINRGAATYGLELDAAQRAGVRDALNRLEAELAVLGRTLLYAEFDAMAPSAAKEVANDAI